MERLQAQSEQPVPRGRPRSFCCEKALDAAQKVFWEKGYEGASLDDLTASMGINRPSLYAAFGNKESLFKKVLKRYGDQSACMVTSAMNEPSARVFTVTFLQRVAESLSDPSHPKGCLALQSGMSMGDGAAAVKDALTEHRKQTQCILAKRYQRAVMEGELPAGTDVGALARYFAVVTHGMSIQATTGGTGEELKAVAETAMRAWPGVGMAGKKGK